MKKSLILIYLFAFVCFAVKAQTETASTSTQTNTSSEKNDKLVSKKGIYILPEQGEYSLGVNATTFFNYFGKFLSNAGATSPSFDYASGYKGAPAIYGKYMLTDNKAVRVRLGIADNKTTDLYPVVSSDPLNTNTVEDQVATQNKAFILAVGMENRRGKSRIQGIYGAELLLGFTKYDKNIKYGNTMDENNIAPAIADPSNYVNGERLIEDNISQVFFVGARAFVGVEVFVAPKFSVGGEFGYSLVYQNSGKHEKIYEYWDGTTNSGQKHSIKTDPGQKFVGFSTDNLSGSINLFFYF